ncbi:hypothetical protein T484DRAFT_1928811 [Baffinella frigidus]|nr:hypothetical protein T484DRAFT_1928811 [Cryptophyta sp. CCMP2293]
MQGGVASGRVNAIARSLDEIIIGGSFSGVGGGAARRIARWDGRRWHAMGVLNGDVLALATIGIYVFVAGDFTVAGGSTVNHIASYHQGKWMALAGGVDASVAALLSVGTCLYIGGAFQHALPPEPPPASSSNRTLGETAPTALKYVARWCVAIADGAPAAVFEQVEGGGDALGPVRVLQYAETVADAGASEEICPLGAPRAIHCNLTLF